MAGGCWLALSLVLPFNGHVWFWKAFRPKGDNFNLSCLGVGWPLELLDLDLGRCTGVACGMICWWFYQVYQEARKTVNIYQIISAWLFKKQSVCILHNFIFNCDWYPHIKCPARKFNPACIARHQSWPLVSYTTLTSMLIFILPVQTTLDQWISNQRLADWSHCWYTTWTDEDICTVYRPRWHVTIYRLLAMTNQTKWPKSPTLSIYDTDFMFKKKIKKIKYFKIKYSFNRLRNLGL